MEAVGRERVQMQEQLISATAIAELDRLIRDPVLKRALESEQMQERDLSTIQNVVSQAIDIKKRLGWPTFLEYAPRALATAFHHGLILDQYDVIKDELTDLIKTFPVSDVDIGNFFVFAERLLTPSDFATLLKAGLENEPATSLVADYIKQSVIQDARQWQSLKESPETAWKLDRLVCKVRNVAKLLTADQVKSCMISWSSGMCQGLHLSSSDILAGHLACEAPPQQWTAIRDVIQKMPDRLESLSALGTSAEGKGRCEELVDQCLQMNPIPLPSLIIFTSKLQKVDSSLALGLWKKVVLQMREQPEWLFKIRERVNIEVYSPRWQVEAYVAGISDVDKVKILEEPKWRFQLYADLRLMMADTLPNLAFPIGKDGNIPEDKGLLDCFLVTACYWMEKKSEDNLSLWLPKLSKTSKRYIVGELMQFSGKSDWQLYYHGLTKASVDALWDRLMPNA